MATEWVSQEDQLSQTLDPRCRVDSLATSISHPSWSWGWGDTEEGTGRRSRKGAIEVPELQDIVIQEEPSPAQRQKEKEVQVWSYPCGRAALQAQRAVQGEGT